nr:Fur family transcriptional regulator [uncultured Anaeromusa sp.]
MDFSVAALLREKGFKVTPQRLAIYQVLINTKAHPCAEAIFNELQPHYPTMSLATVYKTIEILREIGMVQVLNVGEDSFRYDATVKNHPHVRCMDCGRVDDMHDIDATAFVSQVSNKTDYVLSGQQFYFYGVCPACQKKQQAQAQN